MRVKNVLTIITGAIPFVVGSILNRALIEQSDSVLPLILIGLLFLSFWGIVAFVFQNSMKNAKRVVVSLNAIATIDLLLLGIQELVIHAYWGNVIGGWSQLFYLPVIKIGFLLTNWSHTVFSAYVVSFVLMIVVSVLGCRIRIWQSQFDNK